MKEREPIYVEIPPGYILGDTLEERLQKAISKQIWMDDVERKNLKRGDLVKVLNDPLLYKVVNEFIPPYFAALLELNPETKQPVNPYDEPKIVDRFLIVEKIDAL